METKQFWLTKSAYLQQAGDSAPRFIVATPDHPVKVTLPKFFKRGEATVEQMSTATLKEVRGATPPIPKDTIPPQPNTGAVMAGAEKVPDATDVPEQGAKGPKGKVRESDK